MAPYFIGGAVGLVLGFVVAVVVVLIRYGMAGPSPVSPEAHLQLAKSVQLHELRIGNLEVLVGLRKKGT